MSKLITTIILFLFSVSSVSAFPLLGAKRRSTREPIITCMGHISSGCTESTPTNTGVYETIDVTLVNKFDPTVNMVIKQVACWGGGLWDTGQTTKAVVYNGTTKICDAAITISPGGWAWSSEFLASCTIPASATEIYYGCMSDGDGDGDGVALGYSTGSVGYKSQTYDATPTWSSLSRLNAAIFKYEY